MYFNRRDKVEINNIKNSHAFYMLLKKETHATFIDYVKENSSDPVWKKTLSLSICLYMYIYLLYTHTRPHTYNHQIM
jgi:hypothetical protein